ncbi:MAG: hypothetical protein ACK4MI_09475 [Brevundimonas sp.]|uniref:hypothetical protein n=1 Tax=Brevundimonas sp. TaxID=1871086 RepID=UPI0028D25EEA|nr:hypothetical protein [uncultured Brevundimonas sp.]
MDREQTEGREKNGADPAGKPDGATSDRAVKRVGQAEQKSAGPDGPDASVIGDTFKRKP